MPNTMRIDLRKDVCVYIDLVALDNALIDLEILYDEWKCFSKPQVKDTVRRVKQLLAKICVRTRKQIPCDEFDAILSGDRYHQ